MRQKGVGMNLAGDSRILRDRNIPICQDTGTEPHLVYHLNSGFPSVPIPIRVFVPSSIGLVTVRPHVQFLSS